jgi:hypothetical protein
VRISYKGNAASLGVGYSVNGTNSLQHEFNSDASPLINAGTTDWEHAVLAPTTSSLANNIYSFQLHMQGSPDADFEINDISIIYRIKGVR